VRAQTRHQLKQDAFSRATIGVAEKTADWTVEHRNTVIIASLVAIVVIGAAVGGWYYLNTQDQKASLDLSIAVRTMETQLRAPGTPEQPDFPTFTSAKDRSEAARKQLQAIVDKYPHTRSADMAHYFLAVTEKNLGDNASAERDFKEVISKGNKELSSVAKDALAALYADTNRTKDAISLYQDLMNKPTTSVSKVTAQLQLAELYQDSKQPLEAKKMYEQVKKDNPANEAGQLATQRLAQLK
jgi:tetratricopeptide (TPR) repeat protein